MRLTREELIAKIQDIEWDDFEGKTSKKELPADIWRTVSAFSNTSGGWILCGVAQHGKKFEIEGVEDGERIESNFLTTLRNKGKFNHVLHCAPKKITVDGKLVLAFYIPSSELKPIWFNTPKNTYIRSGYGIDKIYSWERLTGEKVEFATDVMSTTVTYWRPKVGTSIKRPERSEGTTPKTTPKTTPTSQKEKGPELRQKMIRIMKATPTISKAGLADLLRITVDGVTYHIRILKKELGVHWEGSSMKGRWVIPE